MNRPHTLFPIPTLLTLSLTEALSSLILLAKQLSNIYNNNNISKDVNKFLTKCTNMIVAVVND